MLPPIVLAMHIPDGFLTGHVPEIGWVLAFVFIIFALRRAPSLGGRQVPLITIGAAFIFAAQMMNFPVTGGTTGHLVGAVIIAILAGPWNAVLTLSIVVAIQALLFQDGGTMALGVNIFNMAVICTFTGYGVYKLITSRFGETTRNQFVGAALAAWTSVVVASIVVSVQLAISGTSPLDVALPAMLRVHALIGIGEALITVAVLALVMKIQPELMHTSSATAARISYRWIAAGLVVALLIAGLSPLADPNPDGLERVAEDLGFIEAAQGPTYEILPDYTTPFVGDAKLSTIVAGEIGVLVVGSIGYLVARMSSRRKEQPLT